jgi:8-amino-7-oxononanoate synthase
VPASSLSPGPEPDSPRTVQYRGRSLLYFGGSDYLRAAWRPDLRRQLARALLTHGPSASASRITTGNRCVYGDAEAALARFTRLPAAVLTSSGYTAPLVAAQAMAAELDVVWLAPGVHPCLQDAARLTGLPVVRLASAGPWPRAEGRIGLFLDGLGALTSRTPDLAGLLRELPASARVLLDDAHGVGTLGEQGRGVLELLEIRDPRITLTFTLTKAFGLAGGVVAGSRELADRIWKTSAAQRASTPIPPAFAAVLPQAAAWMAQAGALRRKRCEALRQVLLRQVPPVGEDHVGPVFLLVPSKATSRRLLEQTLEEAGIHSPFIRYPGGPEEGAFRFALSSAHLVSDVHRLGRILGSVWQARPTDWRWG